MRVRTTVLGLMGLPLFFGTFGCTDEPDVSSIATPKLSGLIVGKPGDATRTLIYLTRRADAQAALTESLAGIERDETSYRIEFDKSRLPNPSGMAAFDLAQDAGIVLTFRQQLGDPGPSDERRYHTHTFRSGPGGGIVSGRLEITGGEAADLARGVTTGGERWGVAFRMSYKGPLEVFGQVIENGGISGNVGALVEMGL